MARHTVGARMTNAPTSTLPGMSIYTNGSVRVVLREVWIYNTAAATATNIALQRLTTTGTQGTALTEMPYNASAAGTATTHNSHTVGPTITTGFLCVATLGAAAGAATVWSFGDEGVIIPATANNGLGLTTPNGTGQVCDVVFVWDE